MIKCKWCKAEVPRGFRRTAKMKKAKLKTKTVYHYACVIQRRLSKAS